MADEQRKKMSARRLDALPLRQISELAEWLDVSDTRVVEAAVAKMHAEEGYRRAEGLPPDKFVWREGDLKVLKKGDAGEEEGNG